MKYRIRNLIYDCDHAVSMREGSAAAVIQNTIARITNAGGTDPLAPLRDLGFATPTAANDPIYAGARLSCQGQIRFGNNGKAAAAALCRVGVDVTVYEQARRFARLGAGAITVWLTAQALE